MMGFLTSPRICGGPGALEQLGALDLHRVALVVDAALVGSPRLVRVRDQLASTEARVEEMPPIRAEPSLDVVTDLGRRFSAFGPDGIVAVGGGSTLDASKGAWVSSVRPELDLAALTPLSELGLRPRCRLVAVPTTAGSGSEANGLAQFHRSDGGAIVELSSRELEPDWALLDPYFLGTLPPAQMAASGVDALAHALEAIASDWANPFTDALAREAAGLLVRELPKGVRHPEELERAALLQSAAAMAGLAAGNAQAGVVHALAHALSATVPVTHARAVAPLLPPALEFNFSAAKERYAGLAGALGPGPVQSRTALGSRVRLFLEQVGAPRSLAEAGVAPSDLAARKGIVIEQALASPSLVGNPRMPTAEELGAILAAATEGRELPPPASPRSAEPPVGPDPA